MTCPSWRESERHREAKVLSCGDQHVEHVALALVRRRLGDPVVHDLLHQLDEAQPRLVAQPEALDRQVRVDVAQRIGALLELVVEPGEAAVELFTTSYRSSTPTMCRW
jgi:hypothetical protein